MNTAIGKDVGKTARIENGARSSTGSSSMISLNAAGVVADSTETMVSIGA